MNREPVSIGFDLGGTHLRAALISGAAQVVARRAARTARFTTPYELCAALDELATQLLEEAGSAAARIATVGIGIPGTVRADGTIDRAPNLPFLDGCNLAASLAVARDIPTYICNDADAAALGESAAGAGAHFASFLMVTLGTGVGGALILDGRLWRGVDGMAGEVGHVMVESQGRPCGCGSHGCLEQYASASGIVLSARELLATDPASSLHDAQPLDSKAIAAAALRGDNVACAAFAEAGRKLGQVFAGIAVNLLNLDGAVVGGGVAPSLDLMRPALERELYRHGFADQARRFAVRTAELGDDAGLIGAALNANRRRHGA